MIQRTTFKPAFCTNKIANPLLELCLLSIGLVFSLLFYSLQVHLFIFRLLNLIILFYREEAAAYLLNPASRDSKKALKGSWAPKAGSSKQDTKDSSSKGKSTKGRPAKNSKSGSSPAKQPRLTPSKDQRTPSQQRESHLGPVPPQGTGTPAGGSAKFKIPRRTALFSSDSEDENTDQGRKLFANKTKSHCQYVVDKTSLFLTNISALEHAFEHLMINSVSSQTWQKHSSAIKSYKKNCEFSKIPCVFPINIINVRGFATWALTRNNLQAVTVKSYISSLKIAHELKIFECTDYSNDKCIKMLLAGANNCLTHNKKVRLAMNFHI